MASSKSRAALLLAEGGTVLLAMPAAAKDGLMEFAIISRIQAVLVNQRADEARVRSITTSQDTQGIIPNYLFILGRSSQMI